jgi:DNA polymerase III subunit delta
MFYLFHGLDDFSMREELSRLRREGGFEHSVDVFAGDEDQISTIRNTCDTLPFLSERRLVVVDSLPRRRRGARATGQTEGGAGDEGTEAAPAPTEAPQAGGRGANGGRKKARAAVPDPRAFAQGLADYVPRLPETTVLVVLSDELLEPSHPLVAAARAHGQVRAFNPPQGQRLEEWLVRRAGAVGARLSPDAARLLAGYVGSDLRLLASEVEKLATYAGQGGQIGVGEVRLLTATTHQARVFDLTDALARRDRRKALALLHELLDAGESPLGIVALASHQTRSLLQVKALAERGMRAAQIAQTAGMSPFVVEKSLPLARQFTFVQLEAAHHTLLEIDAALKLSKATPEMALDLFVVEFGA